MQFHFWQFLRSAIPSNNYCAVETNLIIFIELFTSYLPINKSIKNRKNLSIEKNEHLMTKQLINKVIKTCYTDFDRKIKIL